MRPHRLLPLAALLSGACLPTDAVIFDDDYALEFSGNGCVEAIGAPVSLGVSLTVEAWVLGLNTPPEGKGVVVQLGNAGALWADPAATGFSRPEKLGQTGWQTGVGVFDDEIHHVAATWSLDEGGAIFIDGLRSGTGSEWEQDLPGFDTIRIGCSGSGEYAFQGVIDEVRVSRAIRYDRNFEVSRQPFDLDGDTLALWHLDGGTGDVALEERDKFPGDITRAEWVPGLIDPSRRPGDTGG